MLLTATDVPSNTTIAVDGAIIDNIYSFDTLTQEVIAYKSDANGKLILVADGDSFQMEVHKGSITMVIPLGSSDGF